MWWASRWEAWALSTWSAATPTSLPNFKTNTSFRIFHGDADAVVPVRYSREAYLKLKAEGVNVEYIELPGVNHNSWDPAFNRDDFMPWLFEQNKKTNKQRIAR